MVYEGDFDLNSLATQTIFDIINFVFVFLFYFLLLLSYVRKDNTGKFRKRSDWIYLSVSLCCFLIFVAYLIAGLWEATAKTPQLEH